MSSITLQIGNSDDRLTQERWHEYVEAVREQLENHPAVSVHFFGAPQAWAPWQNAAWVFVVESDALPELREAIVAIRKRFDQDSVAWTVGETEFL